MAIDFPESQEEAQQRFDKWKNIDPFPQIQPALLCSAYIMDYVSATGMVYPFYEKKDDKIKLKPASYEVDLLGEVVYWDENGKKVESNIKPGDEFTLPSNSIAFVKLEPRFLIPDYIAVRFNLKILHVYRGLLLGTGPLVDPGFQGKLFIPLHNLTTNNYKFTGGEGLIWMEFTKVSWPPPDYKEIDKSEGLERQGTFTPFPNQKNERKTLQDYLARASPHKPIRSSIPLELQSASRSAEQASIHAEEAAKNAARVKTQVTIGGIVTAILVVAAIATLTFQALTFVTDVKKDVSADQQALAQDITTLKAIMNAIRNNVSAENKVTAREIQELKAVWQEELGSMRRELNRLEKELKK